MEDYAWLCINARIGNALISANAGRLPRLEPRETQLSKAAKAGWIGTLIGVDASAS
jgi:hypothetical protein